MYGEAKEWLDAFFFDRYLHVQSKWSHPWRPHAWSYSSVPFDRRNATTIVRPHPLHTPLTCKHAQYAESNIPKRDGHTYIHTYIPTQNEMRSRISCLALRRSAIIHVAIYRAVIKINHPTFTDVTFLTELRLNIVSRMLLLGLCC